MKCVHSSMPVPKTGTVLNFWSMEKREVCVHHTYLSDPPSFLHRLLLQEVKHYLAKKTLNGFSKVRYGTANLETELRSEL